MSIQFTRTHSTDLDFYDYCAISGIVATIQLLFMLLTVATICMCDWVWDCEVEETEHSETIDTPPEEESFVEEGNTIIGTNELRMGMNFLATIGVIFGKYQEAVQKEMESSNSSSEDDEEDLL